MFIADCGYCPEHMEDTNKDTLQQRLIEHYLANHEQELDYRTNNMTREQFAGYRARFSIRKEK